MTDHLVDATKLVCPHCGSPADRKQNGIQGYRCGSSYEPTFKPQWARSMTCLELQNGQLLERIKRASNRFFADGSDGKVAAEMLTIMCGIADEEPLNDTPAKCSEHPL